MHFQDILSRLESASGRSFHCASTIILINMQMKSVLRVIQPSVASIKKICGEARTEGNFLFSPQIIISTFHSPHDVRCDSVSVGIRVLLQRLPLRNA